MNIIQEISKQSRLFAEPSSPKPGRESIAADLAEAIEIASNLTYEMRRLENRIVLLKARVEGLQVGT